MVFPYVTPVGTLTGHDFIRFELQFVKTLLEFFPCQSVRFLTGEGNEWGENPAHPIELTEAVRAGVTLVRQENKPVVGPEGYTLFLPVRANGELVAVAVLTGEGENQYGRYSEDWLLERGRLAAREFSLIKHWSMDPESGVLNSTHLRDELQILLGLAATQSVSPAGQLILIEVAMRAQDANQSLQNISRIAAYLDSLLGVQASLHHVGVGVFALIWNGSTMEEAQRFGSALLRKIKRRGSEGNEPVRLRKVHLAIAPLRVVERGQIDNTSSASATDILLDRAWETLATARKRGNFAISVVEDGTADHHLLAPYSPQTMARLKRLWKGENEFSLVTVQKDIADQSEFPSRVMALAGEGVKVVGLDSRRVIVYLPGAEEEIAADWACSFANRINQLGIGTFSMGVASYPCPGFHKVDTPANANKALVHTQFFGAGTITSFSGVSLNISGDIYYNEGDLVSAIREYRLGLNLNPDNVNLLNSLGVIYAQIDDYAKAIPLFERAITLNHGDFMALFNLGFAHLCHGNQDQALLFFERAEKIDDTHFDLMLQLGQLYCQRGKYKAAVRVLTKAEKEVGSHRNRTVDGAKRSDRDESKSENRQGLGHGLVYRYLGEAYKGIGQNREAMTYLQRAARYNSRDSDSLSQLGELYATEKQGLDIALAFCRQAVEIDGGRASYWYRLAGVLDCREEWNDALEAVQRCLTLDPGFVEGLMLKASLHEKMHQPQLARGAYEKVLRLDGTHSRAVKALKKINQTRRKV